MKKVIRHILHKYGYEITKTKYNQQEVYGDISDEGFWKIYDLCKPFTMTSVSRMYALYNAVNYILANNIKGDFVECGVWKGGSSMLMALLLNSHHVSDRRIFLYDTFEGMPEPSGYDKNFQGESATDLLNQSSASRKDPIWCYSPLDEVVENMRKTNFPVKNIITIKGKVEETIPGRLPDNAIALLRLDTDWFESTYHELVYLYPLLIDKGVLIIDDYGHWEGCRKAVDDYFSEKGISMLLHRIDYSGRMGIKQ